MTFLKNVLFRQVCYTLLMRTLVHCRGQIKIMSINLILPHTKSIMVFCNGELQREENKYYLQTTHCTKVQAKFEYQFREKCNFNYECMILNNNLLQMAVSF